MRRMRPLNFVFEKAFRLEFGGILRWLDNLLKSSIFSEQGEHSRCLPKS